MGPRRRAVTLLAAAATVVALIGLTVLLSDSPEDPDPGSCDTPSGQAAGPVADTPGRGEEYWNPERMSSARGAPIPGQAGPESCR
ncbi:hypothetical protein GCM10010185_42620 [Saccharothrix coeruleofusca]|uniref:Uncharacterized protein n=1 Tax=Saccharothrix coeruleofusca TaxID=33919 RepID=A0A918APM6_9PSEU|nr:hypothetical protein GCM10010185_42620 [Saccharothrix coeruleofusca]